MKRCSALLIAVAAFASSAVGAEGARADDTQRNRFWIGASWETSFGFHRAQNDVCKLDASLQPTSGYDCSANAEHDYPSRTDPRENASLAVGQEDRVDGGLSLAAYRFGLVFEVAATDHLLIGVRGGWNNSGSFRSTFPSYVFGESRATFLFGRPLARHPPHHFTAAGFGSLVRPYTLVGVGLGTFNQTFGVPVVVRGGGPAEVNANRTAGPFYATVGAGIRLGGHRSGFMFAPLKMTFALGRHTMALISPEMTIEFGF